MKIITIILFSLLSLSINAKCIEKTKDFIGKGLLTFSWFKIEIYEIAYYKTKTQRNLKLKFKKDISAYYLKQGWDEGLKTFGNSDADKKAIKWLKDNTPDAKEGDCIEYKIVDDKKVEFIYNGKSIANSTNKDVRKMVHYSWIGKVPVDKSLKSKLLGLK